MSDILSTLSDEQLSALYQQSSAPTNLSALSDDQLKALHNSFSGTAADVAKSAGTGVGRGFISLAGLTGDAAEWGARGIDRATQYIGGKLGVDVQPRADRAPTYGSADIQRGVEGVTGKFYEPQTPWGKPAQTVGEFAPGLIGGPVGLGRRALTQVLAPGLASEAAGQATHGTAAEPYARVAGAVGGALAPSAMGRMITPNPIRAERQAAVDTLATEGVTPTAGQKSGSEILRYIEGTLGNAPFAGGKASAANARTGEEFTSAVLKRVGEDAPRAKPEIIDSAFKRIGNQIDTVAKRNTVKLDSALTNDLVKIETEYSSLVNPSQISPAVEKFANDIRQSGNAMSGEAYQAWRARLGALERKTNDPNLSDAYSGLRHALDDAMERSLTASGNRADLAAWKEARNQYRNMLVVEKAATGPGSETAGGLISPAQLRTALKGQSMRDYARGRGDFADLAHAGNEVLAPLPQSGTGPRFYAYGMSTGAGAALANAAAGGPPAITAASIAAALGPGVVGRATMSKPVQSYLGNQAASPILNQLKPKQAAMVSALIAAQQQREGLSDPLVAALRRHNNRRGQ